MADAAPSFDASQPFEVQGTKGRAPTSAPTFDPNKPFEVHQEAASANDDKGGIGANLRSGFEEGLTSIPSMITDPASRMADAVRGALPQNEAPANSTAYALGAGRNNDNPIPVGSISHALNQGLGMIGLNPEDVTANTAPERIARMAGQGTTAVLAPELGAEKLATEAVPLATRVLSRAANTPVATAARKAATGLAAGAVGGTAGEAIPDDHPVLKLVTEAAASILGGGAPEMLGAAADRAIPAIARFAKPLSESGQSQLAADTLRGRATNPENLLSTLDRPGHELVPASQPTTAQTAGDMGLLSLEREQATKNPAEFMQRRTDQNAARHVALEGIQSGANPGDVGDFLRGQFSAFDDQAQHHIDALTAQAQHQAEGLGGAGHPEQHGAGIRDALQQAETTARVRERSLWKAVDPDNSIRVDASPTFQAAQDIQSGMSRFAAPMEGPEKGVFDSLQGSKQLSLGELSDLRSRVSTAARGELITNGNSPAYARLIRLRGAIQNNLADAATNQAAHDTAAVARGEITPAQTIGGKIQGWVNDYYGQRAAQSGAASGESVGAGAGRGSPSPTGPHGTGFQESGGPASGESDTGIPPRPINETDAARLAEATQATKERAGTFNQGPIKATLAKAGTQDVYKLPEARVPEKFFHAGPTSASDIRQLRSTIGDDKANQLLSDYAATSLRRAAEQPDGTLDPGKVAAWQRRYSGAMSEFPEMAQKFSTAAGATDAIAEAAASQRTAVSARNASALGKIVKADNPDDVTRTVGGIFGSKNARQSMADLVKSTASSPEATQGLRQAVADHIAQNFISNTEAGTSGMGLLKSDAYQTFLTKNRGALSEVFSPEEIKTLDAIGADLRRANRSITAVKIPGGSNTAQDIHAIIENNPQSTILDKVMAKAALAVAGKAIAGTAGSIFGFLGANAVSAARTSGLKKVDDLVTEALLDPVLAKNLLRRAPAAPDGPMSQPIAARLRRLAWATAASARPRQQQQP